MTFNEEFLACHCMLFMSVSIFKSLNLRACSILPVYFLNADFNQLSLTKQSQIPTWQKSEIKITNYVKIGRRPENYSILILSS